MYCSAALVLALAPSLPVPQGLTVQVLDARGLVLCPGFIDSLVHVGGGGGERGFARRFPPLQAEQAIESGVTTVIGALGTDDGTRSHAGLLACCRTLNASGLRAFALSG